jgi:hypothetical protein
MLRQLWVERDLLALVLLLVPAVGACERQVRGQDGNTVAGENARPEAEITEQQAPECNVEELGAALVVDTLTLRREVGEFIDSDGQRATVVRYFDPVDLRVAIVRYLGDTRRTSFTFFFADSVSYVALVNHQIYDPERFPLIAAATKQYFYICGGRPTGASYWEDWVTPVTETRTRVWRD